MCSPLWGTRSDLGFSFASRNLNPSWPIIELKPFLAHNHVFKQLHLVSKGSSPGNVAAQDTSRRPPRPGPSQPFWLSVLIHQDYLLLSLYFLWSFFLLVIILAHYPSFLFYTVEPNVREGFCGKWYLVSYPPGNTLKFFYYIKVFVWITRNWKNLKRDGTTRQPYLYEPYLLRNLYAGQEAAVRTRHGATDWIKIGKGVHQGCMLLPCLFNLYAEYIMRNAGLEEAQAGIKIAGRNINNLRYADDTTLIAEREEELKSPLMKVKEESEKAGLKLNIQKPKIMASSPIISWQIDVETMERDTDLIFLGFKITVDSDCSHEINRCLLLGRKAMTNLDSVLKSRDITLPTKVHLV